MNGKFPDKAFAGAFHPSSPGRLGRKEAQPMEELIKQYIKEMKLAAGLNRQRIFEAWDSVSGAGRYTVNRYVKDGILFCSMSSSVVRNQIYFNKKRILELMNDYLKKDELFVKDGENGIFVKDIVLK